jgi:uncharacterized protein YndB with AHSA1/START domain
VSEPRVVELQVRLDADPDAVWPYLTEPELYARWQGVRAELDPQPGGVFRVWMPDASVASGAYLEVTPTRRVVFTWGWEGNPNVPPGSTTVEIDLEADGDGTTLRLRHSGLPDDESTMLHEAGWHMFTSRLAVMVTGANPGPTPT